MRSRMMLIILGLAALAAAFAGAARADGGAEGREWSQLVAGLPRAWADPEELSRRVAGFLKRYPGSPHGAAAYYLCADAFRRLGRYARAAEFYDRSQNAGDGGDSTGQAAGWRKAEFEDSIAYRRGECDFNQQRFAAAESQWRSCLGRFPGSSLRGELLLGLGQACLAQGQLDQASAQYAQLLRAYPAYDGREDVATALAEIDFQRGDYPGAVKRLPAPESLRGQYVKGRVLQALGKSVDAANYFNRVVKSGQEQTPLFKNAYYRRGEAFLLAKDFTSAGKSAASFLERFPAGDPFAPFLRHQEAVIFFELKQYPKALQIAAALGAVPGFPRESLDYFTAECQIRNGQVAKAELLYRKLALAADPRLAQAARLKQAWCAYILRRYPEAMKLFAAYAAAYPGDESLPVIRYLLGRCEAFQGRDAEASKIFRDLVEQASDPLLADLSLLQFQSASRRQGRYDDLIAVSERYLGRAEKRLPDEGKIPRALNIFYLGRAYYQRAAYGQCIDVLQRISNDFWDTPVYPYALDVTARGFFQNGNFAACAKAAQSGLREKQLPKAVAQDLQLLLAHALFNQKQYAEALPNYQKWIESNPGAPQLPQLFYLMGCGYRQLKFYKNALEVWDRLVRGYRRHPLTESALAQSAALYLEGRDFPTAIARYQRLLADWPQTAFAAQARLGIAQAYLAQEDYGQAKSAYQDYLAKHPDDAHAAESGQNLELAAFQEAVKANTPEAFDAFLAEFPHSANAEKVQFLIGQMYYTRKLYPAALTAFARLAKNYPGGKLQPQALYLSGECADLAGDTAAALASYQTFTRGYGGHELMPEVLLRLAVDEFQNKNLPAAVQAFKECADRFPKSKSAPQALYNLVLCYTELKQEPEVMGALTTLAERYPQEPEGREALARLGKYYHEQKAFAKAVSNLAPLVAGGGALPAEIYYRLGDSYENLKEPQKAMRHYGAARRTKPAEDVFRVVALSQLAALLEQDQRLGEALGVYKDIAKHAQEEQWRTAANERIQLLRRYLNESGN